jgi:DNA-binding transcriptional MerR regulator
MPLMNIGELARRTGVSASTIRFYEKAGLLKAVARRPNGYRAYSQDAALTLEIIATAQRAGFTLDEIRKLLPSELQSWDHDALIATLRNKVSEIEAFQKRLAQGKAQLVAVIEAIEARPDDIACAENARRVMMRVLVAQSSENAMAPGEVRQFATATRRRSAGK